MYADLHSHYDSSAKGTRTQTDMLGELFDTPSEHLSPREVASNGYSESELSQQEEEEDGITCCEEQAPSGRHGSRSMSGEVIVVANPHLSRGDKRASTLANVPGVTVCSNSHSQCTSPAIVATASATANNHGTHNPLHGAGPWVPPEEPHRAVHRIRLDALTHNYYQVEAAASRQKCEAIIVVKADGYGHGAVATALHLADHCGAGAFAVATLEEGIALRTAFQTYPPGKLTSYPAQQQSNAAVPTPAVASGTLSAYQRPTRRPAQIRIMVLGPPVGFPRCFDDYYHHDIEVMVSGPEVAASLVHWVADEAQRKRTAVERAAHEAKVAALLHRQAWPGDPAYHPLEGGIPVAPEPITSAATSTTASASVSTTDSWTTTASTSATADSSTRGATSTTATAAAKSYLPHPSSTLGNVQGADLAREVRSLLLHQHEAKIRRHQLQQQQETTVSSISDTHVTDSLDDSKQLHSSKLPTGPSNNRAPSSAPPSGGTLFGGIEAAARSSRNQEAAVVRATAIVQEDEEDTDYDDNNANEVISASSSVNGHTHKTGRLSPPVLARKRLRWHALVDSGMGRLGFKTDIVSAHDKTGRRDTVDILKEMVELELQGNAPLEFFGMCTHMADARDLSDYTQSQIGKFSALLKRVRAAGISVSTLSTDNSAALLTTSLTHFDPVQMLSQAGADTRGYVRTGGAIYGQRPAFKQLKAVSTLLASVRHVAVLKKGDTVGYDRAYVAPHAVRIATLTIGFADGYPRELGNGVGKVQIRGAVFPIAGNVCMDMIMIDLGPASEKAGPGSSVMVGDTAVLWGPLDEDVENGRDNQGLVRLQDIAATLKTTQSALTCGLDKIRVRRQYV